MGPDGRPEGPGVCSDSSTFLSQDDVALVLVARNALPALLRVARAAQAMAEALDDSRHPFRDHPRPLEEHNARFHLSAALAALAALAAQD